MFLRKFFVASLVSLTVLPFWILRSKMRRVMKMEVSTEVMIPMIRVVAKPWTGPEPKM